MMSDLCMGLVVLILLIIFGELAFSLEPYNRAIYPIIEEEE